MKFFRMFTHSIVFLIYVMIIAFTGCSGNVNDVLHNARSPSPPDAYWQLVSIDGVSVDQLFLQGNEDVGSDIVRFITNKWGFFENGNTTHEIGFSITEEYTDTDHEPVPTLTVNVVVTLDGSYTIEDSTITIGTQQQHSIAYVDLEPFDYWQANLDPPILDQLKKDIVDETLSDIPDFTNTIFLENTTYLWEWNPNTELLTFTRILDVNMDEHTGANEIVMKTYDPSRFSKMKASEAQ